MSGNIARIGAGTAGALLALGLFAAPPAGASGSGRHSHQSERSSTSCFDPSGKTQGRSYSDPDGMSNGGADKPGCDGGFDADRDGNNGCGNDADREDDNNGWCGRHKPARAEQHRGNDVKAAKAEADNDEAEKVEAEKVEADIKVRCHGHDHDTTTTTAGATDVAAAGTSNDCSCPKGGENSTGLGTGTGNTETAAASLKPAGTVSGAGVLAAEASTTPPAAPTSVLGETLTAPANGETTTTTAPGTQVLGETLSRPGTLARTGAGVGVLALLGAALIGGGRLTVLARKLLRIS